MLERIEQIAPKQFEIIHYLYKVRGATVEQILSVVWDVPANAPLYESSLRSAYKILKKLVSQKLVKRTSRDFQESGVYYLTILGYEEIVTYLDIQPEYIGTGFNNDQGYFDYSLGTPTLTNIDHFLKQVDVYNVYQALERTNPGTYDYRDNRYAARTYTSPNGGKAKFRPDGEIKVLDDVYQIEVDRATERGEALVNKFKGYNRYFKWLEKNNHDLPRGIIVVIPDRGKRLQNQLINASEQIRFQSFYQAFATTCKDYLDRVTLHLTELRHLQKLLTLMNPYSIEELERKALSYFKSLSTEQMPIAIGEVVGYKIAVVTKGSERHYYFLVNGEGYKSEPWSKFYKVYQKFSRENKHVFLVLYFSTFFPVPPLKGLNLQQIKDIEARKFNEHTFSVDLGASKPIWYDSSRELLEENPLKG